MAIALEFIDFVVPISVIEEKYPGGWKQCLYDHAGSVGRAIWHDEHLFRAGAMAPAGIEYLVNKWSSIGFTPMELNDGKQVWKDVCVVEGMFSGPTLPCEWLEVDTKKRIAFLAGTNPGAVAGRLPKDETDKLMQEILREHD
jgi:hypothetical protein